MGIKGAVASTKESEAGSEAEPLKSEEPLLHGCLLPVPHLCPGSGI